MKSIKDTRSRSSVGPVRDLVFTDALNFYEIRQYTGSAPSTEWGTIFNLRTRREINHSSKRGQAVLAAARKHVAEGVTA